MIAGALLLPVGRRSAPQGSIGNAELREVYPEDSYEWLVKNEPDHIEQEPQAVYEWLQAHAQWLGNRVDKEPQSMQG